MDHFDAIGQHEDSGIVWHHRVVTVPLGPLASRLREFGPAGLLLGADPINQTYHYLAGNTAALPGILFTVIIAAGSVGLVFGTMFAMTKRVWRLIVAHAAFDVTAVFITYQDLESYFAHLFFN